MRSVPTRSPGRPREFDVEDVIRDAMAVFQAQGYAGTSLEDLIEGTKLSRGSLYKAFQGKQSLFVAVLDAYIAASITMLRECLAAGGVGGIRAALVTIGRMTVLELGRQGCLLVNSTTELASKDPVVCQRIEAAFDQMQELLADAVRAGQAAGEIGSHREAEALARFLLCTIEGMGVLGKAGQREWQMEQIVEVAIAALR